MEEYAILKAEIRDVPRILELTRAHTITRDSPVPGFLEFPIPDNAAYRARLESSNFCYVATAKKPIGFFLAYPRISLEQGFVSGPIANRLLQLDENFIYLEQIIVENTHRRRGIARALFDRCLRDAEEARHPLAYGATSHQPVRNVPLINLHHEFGFRLKEEIAFDGLSFGLYSKHLP
ncbi:GNAT family N-acetyltransferase [Candidatus Woesearchaeota archaeon]|nr:MAG: GNAT family N-acetyltransferase [Candidatus Woesearchaeota archaeon]